MCFLQVLRLSSVTIDMRKRTTTNLSVVVLTELDVELANALNMYFVFVNADIPALDISRLLAYLPVAEEIPTLEPYQVCNKLIKLL